MLIHILFQKQIYLDANIRAPPGITQLHSLDIDARVDPLPQRNLLHFVSAVFCSARAQRIPSVAGATVGPPWGHGAMESDSKGPLGSNGLSSRGYRVEKMGNPWSSQPAEELLEECNLRFFFQTLTL